MSHRFLRPLCHALLCTCCLLAGRAQVVAPVADARPARDEPVTLSVFEVTAEKDIGYAATGALTGTRTIEKLENLPNSISVMTQDCIQDLAFNNYLDAVGFGMSTENIANDNGTVGGQQLAVAAHHGAAPTRVDEHRNVLTSRTAFFAQSALP